MPRFLRGFFFVNYHEEKENEKMLTDYIDCAMERAHYEILEDDKSYYGEIKDCEGVYANASTLEECRKELEQTLEDWILLRVSKNLSLPQIGGIDLRIKEVA
jgi:predicted RNase H-like HicB family nuclease